MLTPQSRWFVASIERRRTISVAETWGNSPGTGMSLRGVRHALLHGLELTRGVTGGGGVNRRSAQSFAVGAGSRNSPFSTCCSCR